MRNVTINLNKESTNQPSQKWHSLQEYTPNTPKNSSKNIKVYFSRLFPIKGISALFFHDTSIKASMSVEAAMVLPIFLFSILNILWVIEVYRLHSTLLYALHETGTKMTIYGYAYQEVSHEKEDTGLEALVEDVAFTELYVRGQVNQIAGENYLDESPLTNGKKGLWFIESSIMQQNDTIDLVAAYRVSPFIHLPGLYDARFYTRFYGRAWTGYANQEDEKKRETMVYVTSEGTVYHTSTKCKYLDLSIEEKRLEQIAYLRNASGEKYHPCEVCGKNAINSVFITKYGNKYHSIRNCSGLKRNIQKIPLSKAKTKYKPCPGCGR